LKDDDDVKLGIFFTDSHVTPESVVT